MQGLMQVIVLAALVALVMSTIEATMEDYVQAQMLTTKERARQKIMISNC